MTEHRSPIADHDHAVQLTLAEALRRWPFNTKTECVGSSVRGVATQGVGVPRQRPVPEVGKDT